MFREKNTFKLTSFCVAVIFFITSTAQAAPSCYKINVPEEYGKVTQRYKGNPDKPCIVHIQDAHSSLEAQKNIAAIIRKFAMNKTTNTIGVEGAVGNLPIEPFRSFPIKEARNRVSFDYMKEGKFTASEYAAITSDEALNMYGVEDKELFEENFKDFYQTVKGSEGIIQYVAQVENALKKLKRTVYNPQLKAFDEAASKYETGDIGLADYIPVLYEHIVVCGIDPILCIQLNEFKKVAHLESMIDFKKADHEKADLLEQIEDSIGEKDLDKYVQNEVYQYIKHQAADLKIPLKNYSQFIQVCSYNQVYAGINFGELIEEVTDITNEIRIHLSKSPDEKELIQQWRHIKLLRKVFSLQAQRKEVVYFRENKSQFDFSYLRSSIKALSRKYNIPYTIEECHLGKSNRLVDEFYEGAMLRDSALVNNLLEYMQQGDDEVSVLVAGGFHSDGICEELKKRNISFVTVAPNVSSIKADLPYIEKMTGELFSLAPHLISNITALSLQLLKDRPEFFKFAESFTEESLAEVLRIVLLSELHHGQAEQIKNALVSLGGPLRKYQDTEFIDKIEMLRERFDEFIRYLSEQPDYQQLTRKEIQMLIFDKLSTFSAISDENLDAEDKAYKHFYWYLVRSLQEFYSSSRSVAPENSPRTIDRETKTAQGTTVASFFKRVKKALLERSGYSLPGLQITEGMLNEKTAIPLDAYIPYRKLYRAEGNSENDIVNMTDNPAEMKRLVTKTFSHLEPARINDLITRQAPFEQSILELISNASDAVTGRTASIGRFGMGALQMLAFVIDENNLALEAGAHIVVETATKKGQGRALTFFKGKDNKLYFTPPVSIKKKRQGTTVRIVVPQGIPKSLQSLIQDHLRNRMNLFTKMKVFMNEELLNPLDDHIYLNGDRIQYSHSKEEIHVSITDDEIIVDDPGSGMSDDVIFNKYLIPRLGENEATPNLSDDEIREQVHVFYKAPPYSKELTKSHIVFQVSGDNIQEVTVEGYNLPKELVIQLPSSTKLTVSRDGIEIDESTHRAVKMLAEKIVDSGRHPAHQIALINGFMQAVKMLDERNGRIDVYQSLADTAKDVFVPFLMQEEKLMLPNSPEYHALEFPDDTIFIDSDLIYKITPELIPGSTRLTTFDPGTYRKAFIVPFKENSKVTYLPLGPYLLINQQTYEKFKHMPFLLNLRLNFYVGYGRRPPAKGHILHPKEYAERKDLQASLLLEKYPIVHETLSQKQMVWVNDFADKNIDEHQRLEALLSRLNYFLEAIPQDIRDQIKWEDILPFSSVRSSQLKKLLIRSSEIINPDVDFITLHSHYFLNREYPERIRRYLTNLLLPDGITQYTEHSIFHHLLSQVDSKALNYIDTEILDAIDEVFETRNLESYEDAFKAINKGLPYVRGDGVKRLILRWLRIYKNDPKSAESFAQKLGKYYRRSKKADIEQKDAVGHLVKGKSIPDFDSKQDFIDGRGWTATGVIIDGKALYSSVQQGATFIEFSIFNKTTGKMEQVGSYHAKELGHIPNSVEWTGLTDNEGRYVFVINSRYHTAVITLDAETGATKQIKFNEHLDLDSNFIEKTSWGEPGKPVFILLDSYKFKLFTFDLDSPDGNIEIIDNDVFLDTNSGSINAFQETGFTDNGKPIFLLDTESRTYFYRYDPATNQSEEIRILNKRDKEELKNDASIRQVSHGDRSFFISVDAEGHIVLFDYDIKADAIKNVAKSKFRLETGRKVFRKIGGLHDEKNNPVFAFSNPFGDVTLFSINFEKRDIDAIKNVDFRISAASNLHIGDISYDKENNILIFGTSWGLKYLDLEGIVAAPVAKAVIDKQEIFLPDEFEKSEMTTFSGKEKEVEVISHQITPLKKDGKTIVVIKRDMNIEFHALDPKTETLSLLGAFEKEKDPDYFGFGQQPQDVQFMGLNSERKAVFAALYKDNYIRVFTFNLETGETNQIREYDSKGAPGVDTQMTTLEKLDIVMPGRQVFSLSSSGTFHFISIDLETGELQDLSEENEIFQSFVEQLPSERRDNWEYKTAKSRGELESDRKKPQLSFISDTGEEIKINSFGHRMVWENKVIPVNADLQEPLFVSYDDNHRVVSFSKDSNGNIAIKDEKMFLGRAKTTKNIHSIFRVEGMADQQKRPLFIMFDESRGLTFFSVNPSGGTIQEIYSDNLGHLKYFEFSTFMQINSVRYDNNSGLLFMSHQDGVIAWRIKDKEIVDIEDSYWDEEWVAPETRTGFAALDQRDDLSGFPPLVRIIARFLKDKNVTFVEEELPDPRDEKWTVKNQSRKPIPLALMNYLFDRYSKEIKNNPKISFDQFLNLAEESEDINISEYSDIIRSAIQGQDKTQRAWVRELIQNARDAMRRERESGKLGKTEGKIEIRNFIHEGNWIYSIRDHGGMNLWHLLRYYFPLDQTSKDHLIDTGNLGQGNYTLFADFDEVFIRTSTGDGTIHEIIVRQDSQLGPVIESWEMLKGKYKGTEIRRAKKSAKSDPQLESLFIQEALENFAGAVQSPEKRIDEGKEPTIRDFDILYNGESFSEDIDMTAESDLGDGWGTVAVGRAKDQNRHRVMQDGLFIKSPDAEELKFVPQRILNAFERFGGIHISIGREILLNIPRTGYSQRHKFIHRLQMAVLHNIIKTILKDYMERNASIYAMPPDYFDNENVVDNPNGQEIAELMFRGEYDKITQDMIEPFIQDPIKFFELASHVPFTSERHNGEVNLHRLRELRLEANKIRRAREERARWEQWGKWHSGSLDKIFEGKTLGSEFSYDFGGKEAIEGKAASEAPQGQTPSGKPKAPEIDQTATNYFLGLNARVLTPVVGNDMPSLGFFIQDNNVRAHAGTRFGQSILEWNLSHVKNEIEELYKLSQNPEKLQRELELSSEETLVGRFFNTLIHESQHLPKFENPGDHTHHADETVDDGFAQRMGKAFDIVLYDINDFVQLFVGASAESVPIKDAYAEEHLKTIYCLAGGKQQFQKRVESLTFRNSTPIQIIITRRMEAQMQQDQALRKLIFAYEKNNLIGSKIAIVYESRKSIEAIYRDAKKIGANAKNIVVLAEAGEHRDYRDIGISDKSVVFEFNFADSDVYVKQFATLQYLLLEILEHAKGTRPLSSGILMNSAENIWKLDVSQVTKEILGEELEDQIRQRVYAVAA